MIKTVVENIGGVGLYGIVSICIFFAFFVVTLIWSSRLKKNYIESMRGLPLDGGETTPDSKSENQTTSENSHE